MENNKKLSLDEAIQLANKVENWESHFVNPDSKLRGCVREITLIVDEYKEVGFIWVRYRCYELAFYNDPRLKEVYSMAYSKSHQKIDPRKALAYARELLRE